MVEERNARGRPLDKTSPTAFVMAQRWSAIVSEIRDDGHTSLRRIQITRTAPGLHSGTSPTFSSWRRGLLDFITAQPGVDQLAAQVMAHCGQATAMTKLGWATEQSKDVPIAVGAAFERLLDDREP